MKHYDVIVIGAGPGGIFATYELVKKQPELTIGVFESGNRLSGRKCPIDGDRIKSCIHCKSCSIMSGVVQVHFQMENTTSLMTSEVPSTNISEKNRP